MMHTCDVVADGKFATEVPDIRAVPSWSFFQAVKTPLLIMLGGVVASILAGVAVAAWTNPRLRRTLVSLVEAINPAAGKLIKALTPDEPQE